ASCYPVRRFPFESGGQMGFSRRDFLATAVVGSLSLGLEAQETKVSPSHPANAPGKRPVIVSSYNGYPYMEEAFEMMRKGTDTLDAALRVVRGPEDDPNDDSVGYGGLPNEEGVVELDASCMHGPTRRAGAVGGVRNIKNVSLVAKAVMDHTGHVMLVGDGAERFAVAAGFPRENLLTERSRKIWFLWKKYHSSADWWGPGPATQAEHGALDVRKLEGLAAEVGIELEFRALAVARVLRPPTGTIHCSALSAKGEISGVTTTSGLAFKLPGRLGDSPIIGAGCFTDPEVGSAGATGSGEENIKVAGAPTIVEKMRRGMSPPHPRIDPPHRTPPTPPP